MTARATSKDDTVAQPGNDHLSALAARLRALCETCAEYHNAAAIYEELSPLPDGELQRRGLSRETLGRDVCAACDRTSR